jgi:hypothetical protein
MKTFTKIAAQGEITIIRVGGMPATCAELPAGCSALKPEGGKFVIGHSETGHHHVIDAKGASVGVMERTPQGVRILHAILQNPTSLEHLRDHDTHEPIKLEPGEYEFRIGREYDPYSELARQQAD